MLSPIFFSLLVQVFFVGMLIGSVRTVLPVISELDFGLSKNSLSYATTIILAFGLVKALSNISAGFLSDIFGRKKVLLLGWLIALPVPLLLGSFSSWAMIVLALFFLGINQGLAWSMTQSAKIDITNANDRGHAMGLNEFAGYIGVALSGVLTAAVAEVLTPIRTISLFTGIVICLGLITALFTIRETKKPSNGHQTSNSRDAKGKLLSSFQVLKLVSWQDKKMMAVCQAGLVEKFVDALIWVFFPIYYYQNGLKLVEIGSVVAVYGVVWGMLQLFTGRLSDKVGRSIPIVIGMIICALGILLTITSSGLLWWTSCSAIIGIGMALLYPNLSAAITDLSHDNYRSSALGIYRFWRDLGYSVAGILFLLMSHISGDVITSFIFVCIAMTASALVLACYFSLPEKILRS